MSTHHVTFQLAVPESHVVLQRAHFIVDSVCCTHGHLVGGRDGIPRGMCIVFSGFPLE